MPATTVRVDQQLWSALEAQKPHFLSSTAYLNLIISQHLDTSFTLAEGTPTKGGPEPKAVKAVKAVNKTANKERARGSSKTIPEELLQHKELIEQFWKHTGGQRSELAWTGLMRELLAIQQHMEGGTQAVAEQLQKGAEEGWQSITLSNYLKFAVGRPGAPAQGKYKEPEPKHPAFRDAREIIAEQEAKWKNIPSVTGGRGVLEPDAF